MLWFRRDLRLADHPALSTAAADGPVVPLFVLDPRFLSRAGAPRLAFLLRGLAALDEAMGGALVVRTGDPVDVVPALAAEVGAAAVHVTADFGPYGRRRDDGVARALADDGRRLVRTGSPYAVAPGTVTKGDGRPYAVFTPFARAWRASGWDDPLPVPDVRWHGRGRVRSEDLPAAPATDADLPPAGEDAAHDRWEAFATTGSAHYDRDRDRPDRRRHLGAVPLPALRDDPPPPAARPPRPVPRRTGSSRPSWPGGSSTPTCCSTGPSRPGRTSTGGWTAMPVDTGAAARRRFEAWRDGRTGYPIVDAGMRQLLATRLDAQPGADGRGQLPRQGPPPAVAVGRPPLPAPPGRRRPGLEQPRLAVDGRARARTPRRTSASSTRSRQSQRFDPDGAYIRRWVPELAHARGGRRARTVAVEAGRAARLRAPIVDHAAEREESLRRYELTKRARA